MAIDPARRRRVRRVGEVKDRFMGRGIGLMKEKGRGWKRGEGFKEEAVSLVIPRFFDNTSLISITAILHFFRLCSI